MESHQLIPATYASINSI